LARFAVILFALLIAAAAPARTWCEATCLAPASTETHCPSHEPAQSGKAIGTASIDNCPVLDSARPTTIARVELKATIVTTDLPQFTPSRASSARIAVTPPVTTVFQRHIPLRV
jgi:hypothetical protein